MLFGNAERWAVGVAHGFVDGRIAVEDQAPSLELISRLLWPRSPDLPAPAIPPLLAHMPVPPPHDQTLTAGPFGGLFSIKIPPYISDLMGLPKDTGYPQTAIVTTVHSPENVTVEGIPTCTDKDIFRPLSAGEHPPHPVIQFTRPVNHVHVRLSNPSGKLLWDASYDLQGKSALDNTAAMNPIPGESLVPEYIPACTVGPSTDLRLHIDAERMGGIEINFLNPAHDPASDVPEPPVVASTRPPGTEVPQQELESPDAVICKVVKPNVAKDTMGSVGRPTGPHVHLPPVYKKALWGIDRTREESSDLNPHGMPMKDITDGKRDTGGVKDPLLAKLAPTAVGSGKSAVHLLPRRPRMDGEIEVLQLERGKFNIFDSRHMPTDIRQVDSTAILNRPGGVHQPTVDRTLYSPMWQGVHDHAAIHPSVEFKHPVSVARVTLTDTTDKHVVYDAIFNVNGNRKIAADQKPVGGDIQEFKGINPPTGGGHMYSMKIDADNPMMKIAGGPDRVMDFWRKAEFLFGASRPVVHSEVSIAVTNDGGNGTGVFRQ